MSEEMSEEEVKKRQQWRKDLTEFDNWCKFISPKEDRLFMLLFNINKTLKRIADSLGEVAEHFDFVDNKKVT